MNEMQYNHADFVNRLKLFMEKIKKKGYELAAAAGIKPQSVSGYKNSGSLPKAEVLAAWADKFNLNINWLLTGQGEMLRTNSSTNNAEVDAQRVADLEKTVAALETALAAKDELLAQYRKK